VSSKQQVNDLFTQTVDDWAGITTTGAPESDRSKFRVATPFCHPDDRRPLAKGSKILDVGCGTGHLAAELARRGYDTWGTDLSAGMVDYAAPTITRIVIR